MEKVVADSSLPPPRIEPKTVPQPLGAIAPPTGGLPPLGSGPPSAHDVPMEVAL